MDLFAKDHPLEAAAMRTQSAKPKLSGFEFEELPPTRSRDDGDSYASEHDKLSDRILDLMIIIGVGDNQMRPEIMRTNKKIHEEAAAVLYGENWFSWSLDGVGYQPMWYFLPLKRTRCPHHYSRLITKICIVISTKGDENDPFQADTLYWTHTNVDDACKKLTLNDLKILTVDFYSGSRYRNGGSERMGHYAERCLEPLKKCRAEKFLINKRASRAYAAELKAVIEGPKGAKFRAYRKAKEEEPESDYEEGADVTNEFLNAFSEETEVCMGSVEGEPGNEDEGISGMQGTETA